MVIEPRSGQGAMRCGRLFLVLLLLSALVSPHREGERMCVLEICVTSTRRERAKNRKQVDRNAARQTTEGKLEEQKKMSGDIFLHTYFVLRNMAVPRKKNENARDFTAVV